MLAVGLLLAVGCDTQNLQRDFAEEAALPPRGFTETLDGRTFVSEDPDDWRTAPVYAGVVRVDPAYPNPATGGTVTINLSVTVSNAVRSPLVLRANDPAGRFLRLDEVRNVGSPGFYAFTFNPAMLGQSRLVRLYVFDGAGEIVSYGDLQLP